VILLLVFEGVVTALEEMMMKQFRYLRYYPLPNPISRPPRWGWFTGCMYIR